MPAQRPVLAGLFAATASAAAVLLVYGLPLVLMFADPSMVWAAVMLFLVAFVIALAHVLAIGLPFYSNLSMERRRSAWINLGASFLIGAVPLPSLSILSALLSGSGVQAFLDGEYVMYLAMAALFGAFGMVGGFTFWLTLRKSLAVAR